MAKKDKPERVAARRAEVVGEEEKLVALLRKKAQQFLRLPGVTSVGVGRKDDKPDGELCIQFTVEKKLSPEQLEAEGMQALPEFIADDEGKEIEVHVIQRSFKPSFQLLEAREAEDVQTELSPRELRRSRLEKIMPGVSVSHPKGTAGTLGGIVFDNKTGQAYVLSNWHVLHGPEGKIDDDVVQPGPFDNNEVERNVFGRLVRSHLGLAGDCAIATVEKRDYSEEILELNIAPRRTAKVNIGDAVVKSGRTTGVTFGVVARVGVVANIHYGGSAGVQEVGGFEIRPNPDKPPIDGEISKGGDSGSLWLIDGADNEKDIVVGLHFAGETDPNPSAEHALACNIHSVLEKLDVSFEDTRSPVVSEEQLWNEALARIDLLHYRLAAIERRGPCPCAQRTAGVQAVSAPVSTPQPMSQPTAVAEGLPVYGNWCGPGHGGGTPVDDLDRACMRHDECYRRRGYFDCQCDAALMSEIDRALAAGDVRPLGRAVGPLIRAWFTAQPCVYHINGVPIPGGTGGIAYGGRLVVGGVKAVAKAGKKAWKKIKSWF